MLTFKEQMLQQLMTLHDNCKSLEDPELSTATACIYVLIVVMADGDKKALDQLLVSMSISAAPFLQAISQEVNSEN